MANLTETSVFTSGIYQLEIADPVEGGAGGIANSQAQALANRTKWLKDKTAALDVVDAGLQTAINDILRYIPKNRGRIDSMDPNGETVGAGLLVTGISSAIVQANGSNSTTVRITLPNAMPTMNYAVKISIESQSADIDSDNNLYTPVWKKISTTQFDLTIREATPSTQNIRVHIEVFNLA